MAETTLKPDQVQYLSFEGGGGKGYAYFWALLGLMDDRIKILQKVETSYQLSSQIKGISGSSAGAILATVIASKIPLEVLCQLIFNASKKEMIDEIPGSSTNRVYPEVMSAIGYESGTRQNKKMFAKWMPDIVKAPLLKLGLEYLGAEDLVAKISKSPLSEKKTYANIEDDMASDYGILSGSNILDSVNAMMNEWALVYIKRNPQLTANNAELKKLKAKLEKGERMTFKEHNALFGIELVLSGVNLLTEEPFYFSYKTTPDMFVSDAVRISLSIPVYFKPVFIKPNQASKMTANAEYQKKLVGLWVDGGTINNIPIHVFDNLEGSNVYAKSDKLNPNVLGFSFIPKIETSVNDVSLKTVAQKTFGILLSNLTNLQFNSPSERNQIVGVDAGLLSTYSFVPSFIDIMSAAQTTLNVGDYFNVQVSIEDLVNKLDINEFLKRVINDTIKRYKQYNNK